MGASRLPATEIHAVRDFVHGKLLEVVMKGSLSVIAVFLCCRCLKDCGGDAHAHVAQCGAMHGSFATFTAHHREKRRIKVLELIEAETQEVQTHLRRLLQKDLEDLGIVL